MAQRGQTAPGNTRQEEVRTQTPDSSSPLFLLPGCPSQATCAKTGPSVFPHRLAVTWPQGP